MGPIGRTAQFSHEHRGRMMSASQARVLAVCVGLTLLLSILNVATNLGYVSLLTNPDTRLLTAIEKATNGEIALRMIVTEIHRYAEEARTAETGARTAAASLATIAILFSV